MRPAALALVIAVAACGKDGGKRIHRDRDAGASAAPITRGTAALGRTDEREPNNDAAVASALPPGHLARGSIDGEADVDVYRVAVAAPGQLKVSLSGIDGVDLALELRDAGGAVLAKSDRGPALTTEGFPNFAVRRGDYVLVVKEFVKPRKKPKPAKPSKKKGAPPPLDAGVDPNARVGASPIYELSVEVLDAPDLQELEPDDDAGGAVDLMLGDSVRGWLGWNGDVDVWKVPLEGMAPQYALDLEVTGVDGVTLDVQVQDAGGATVIGRKGAKAGGVTIRGVVPALGAGSAPFHLVRIAGDRSHPDSTYELRVTTRLLDTDEEAEPNDDAAAATPLRADVSITSGAMRASYSLGDVDRYVLDPQAEPGLLDVALEPPTGIAFALELVAGDTRLAGVTAAKVGDKVRLTGVAVPTGQPLIVTVKAAKPAKGDGGEARPYRLTWSLAPAGDPLPMPPEEPPSDDAPPVDDLPPEEPADTPE